MDVSTFATDLQIFARDKERHAFAINVFNKYRGEFLSFVEEIMYSGIAQKLYKSATPEETIAIWEKYSSENRELFARIRSWAKAREAYFTDGGHECMPLFEPNEKVNRLLEVGVIIFIIKDCFLFVAKEDINEKFTQDLVALLKKSPNRMLKAAGYFIECEDIDAITRENIYKYYNED